MYPSQNWLKAGDCGDRFKEAQDKIDSGFRISLSTVLDLVFHLGVRQFLLPDGESYYVTDVSKGAMRPKDEEATDRSARWHRWYPRLQAEMELVLGEVGSRETLVIPVSVATAQFLKEVDFRTWLERKESARFAPPVSRTAVTHWAARPPRWWQGTHTFLEEYGDGLYELADVLLDEVGATGWWRDHVHTNFERIGYSQVELQCEWLIGRYEQEHREIRATMSRHD